MLIRHIDKEIRIDSIEIVNFDMSERLYFLNHHLIGNRGFWLWVRVDNQYFGHYFVCRGSITHSFEAFLLRLNGGKATRI